MFYTFFFEILPTNILKSRLHKNSNCEIHTSLNFNFEVKKPSSKGYETLPTLSKTKVSQKETLAQTQNFHSSFQIWNVFYSYFFGNLAYQLLKSMLQTTKLPLHTTSMLKPILQRKSVCETPRNLPEMLKTKISYNQTFAKPYKNIKVSLWFL